MMEAEALVCVVDDDAALRESLINLLRSVGLQVAAFASAQEFLRRPHPEVPSCLVLDVRLPGLSGLELQHALNAADSIVPIVFITGHGSIPMSVSAMKAGAADFLPKPVRAAELLGAIDRAIARGVRARAERAEREAMRSRLALLTPREREVMALVVAGRLNKQIAAELGAGEKTVKVHRARVMEKTRAGSVAELVRMVQKAGLQPG
jgi:FixJ family two-component response regulator